MRRLKDLVAPASPIEADAVDLLRAAAGYDPPPGQKQRVRARLLAQRVVVRRAVRFRPSVAVATILFGAVASAAAGRHWIARTVESLARPVTRPGADGLTLFQAFGRRSGGKTATPDEIATAEPAAVPATEPLAEGTASADRGMVPRRRAPVGAGSFGRIGRRTAAGTPGAGRLAPEVNAMPAAGAPAASDRSEGPRRTEDTGLVFDAMHALRQERAPGRALALLDEYLRRHPAGPQAEEALALSVEAAMTSGDSRARDLINQYASRYPSGHFRATVERARARLSP